VVGVSGYRSGGPGFDSRVLQEKTVVSPERGPLSLVSTTEELLGRNSSDSGLESREYGRKDSFVLTLLTCGGSSVGIVRLWTEATEFFF
jgi:hypothetical protein